MPALAKPRASVAFALTVALAATLPFEPIRPLFFTPWLEVNHLKLLVGAIALVWTVSLVARPNRLRAIHLRWGVIGPAAAILVVAVVSALSGPGDTTVSLKFVGRMATGLFILGLAIHVATTPARIRTLLWAVTIGAGVSACVGLGEAAGWPLIDPLLGIFKVAPSRVGGDLRVSATFQYVTIASMYFELAIPLALVLASTAPARLAQFVAAGVAVACTAAVVLTLTRAGIGVLVVVFALLLALAARTRPGSRGLALPTSAAAVTLVGLVAVLAARSPSFDTRLTTENDLGWYAATYDAPAALSLGDSAASDVTIGAHNDGQATWTTGGDHPFALGYRWLSDDGAYELDVPHTEVALPHDVRPGETVQLTLHLPAAPPPGDYRVAWGMLQRGIVWFHYRGSADAESSVHVASLTSPAVSAPGRVTRDDGATLTVVSRSELWNAALRMIRERPLLGVGPDMFRHLYGPYLGMTVWDDRVHANNLYLEILTDLGLLGGLAFAALVAPAIAVVVRTLRAPAAGQRAVWVVGLGSGLLAFFLHGALDYFLEFTSVYMLFWLVTGLLLAAPRLDSRPAAVR